LKNKEKLLEQFSSVKVLIVGDVMLDRYWWGSVSRISPEAPVPVVRLEKTSLAAGGAANVAANVVGLGAETFLFGIVGDDAEAQSLAEILENSNIAADYLIALENHQTTVKTRIVAHSQQVVRLDQENTNAIGREEVEIAFAQIEKKLEIADVVIISDYAKGFLTDDLLSRLITKCAADRKHVLVDPKGKDYLKYTGATILTPNQKEAADACGLEADDRNVVGIAGDILLEKFSAAAVLITQGEKGMTLFQKNGENHRFGALARKVYDVTGAGDTVIATLAVAIGAGLNFYEAAELANIAAGLVVEQIGTTAISREMLERALAEIHL